MKPRTYRTARLMLGLVSLLGLLSALAGLAVGAVSLGAPASGLALGAAAVLFFGGLFQIAGVQVARAALDTAETTQAIHQLLLRERAPAPRAAEEGA